MSRATEDANRRLLRARDVMDRAFAEPLDITALARIAYVSEAQFIRPGTRMVSQRMGRRARTGPGAAGAGALLLRHGLRETQSAD
jgi:transcriptional regulator GlxA family with amidase domain